MIEKSFQITPQANDFKIIPEGTYQVIIDDVADKKQPIFSKPNQEETVLNFRFKILADGEHKNRFVWKKVRPVISEGWSGGNPSNLFSILKAVGVEPDPELMMTGTDLNSKFIGKQLTVVVKEKTSKDGKIYNVVSDFLKVKNDLPQDQEPEKEEEIQVDDLPM